MDNTAILNQQKNTSSSTPNIANPVLPINIGSLGSMPIGVSNTNLPNSVNSNISNSNLTQVSNATPINTKPTITINTNPINATTDNQNRDNPPLNPDLEAYSLKQALQDSNTHMSPSSNSQQKPQQRKINSDLEENLPIQVTNDDNTTAEIEALSQMIQNSPMPAELADRCVKYVDRLKRMNRRGTYTGEFETVEKYIGWVTSLPWKKISDDNLDINNAKKLMDDTHYGMNTVKNLILDYLAVMQLKARRSKLEQSSGNNPEQNNEEMIKNNMAILRGSSANAPVMLFVGLQGVGKTSIAKSIANAMGREFIRISVGAMGDVRMLRGSFRGNPDAEPGQIIKALIKCKTMNPIILLDEIDKASGNTALLSDIMASLLEILDPEQNATFVDHYIDYPIDLSKVFFICTANNLGTLSAALLDRMEVIRFSSYTDEEKRVIAEKYAFPKVLRNTGLPADAIQIREDVWSLLIRPVGFDAGIRQLERNLATLARSAARKILEGTPTPIIITPENVKQFVLPDQGPLS
ncbi:MAG TPA: AAA family ATPase [Candidatus Dojkabacteria bacterium]|nr:AAA family ATPase [Candidatus Dojkabacteria bacterium]